MTITEFCRKHEACSKGMKWAVKNCKDMNEVWQNAKPEWLVWIATREGVLTDKELRLFAVWCERQVQHLMPDERSIAALDVAERRANGNATDEELRTAAWVARAAASDVAWMAAWRAAEAARDTVGVARDTVGVVAREAVRAAQAEYLRKNCKPNFRL